MLSDSDGESERTVSAPPPPPPNARRGNMRAEGEYADTGLSRAPPGVRSAAGTLLRGNSTPSRVPEEVGRSKKRGAALSQETAPAGAAKRSKPAAAAGYGGMGSGREPPPGPVLVTATATASAAAIARDRGRGPVIGSEWVRGVRNSTLGSGGRVRKTLNPASSPQSQ